MLAASLISLLFWVLVMFGPGTTIIHQGSYATMLLLFTGLALLISGLPRFLVYFLLTLHITLFVVIWAVTLPSIASATLAPIPKLGMAVLAIATLMGIIKTLHRLSQQELTPVEP